MGNLQGAKIAIVTTNGFEESELTEPKNKLSAAGATVHVLPPESGQIRRWNHAEWSKPVAVDRTIDKAQVSDYNAFLIPRGQINPDILRANERAVSCVRAFAESGEPVTVICHGSWMLIEADLLRNRRATSY